MYLFTRTTRLAGGNGTAGVEWAGEMTALVNDKTDLDVQLWGRVLSPAFGTIGWTMWLPDLATFEKAADSLQADAAYQQMADKGASLTEGGIDDTLYELLHGAPDPEADPQYVSAVAAACRPGHLSAGVLNGIEISQRGAKITGVDGLFVRSVTGPYSGVGWLTGFPDIASLEAAQSAMAGDPDWPAFLDGVTDAYIDDPAITQANIFRKLA